MDRAGTLRRVDAGVRRYTMDHELVAAAPLAARLDGTARQSWLEHQDGGAAARLHLDQRTRGRAAGFLISGPQHHDLRLWSVISLEERPGRQHPERDPGFHVEDAGTVQAPVAFSERHEAELSDIPDRVEVAKQQDLSIAPAELGAKMIAGDGLCDGRDARADRLQALSELPSAGVNGRLVVRGRLAGHERSNGLEQPRLFGFAER